MVNSGDAGGGEEFAGGEVRYSSIITLKKLMCAITQALHEQQKYRGVFASAQEIDDISTACRVLKISSRV